MPTSLGPASNDATDLAPLLGRVGLELSHLAGRVDDLQLTLSPVLIEAASAQPHLMASLQGLDLMGQTLANLSGFLALLAKEPARVGSASVQDALGTISLLDLRRRLTADHDAPFEDLAAEVELF